MSAYHGMPAESELGRERLRVDRLRRDPPIVLAQNRPKRTATKIAGNRSPDEIENRRQKIDLLHRDADTPAGAFTRRLLDEQRHPKDILVELRAQPGPPAISGEHDGGVVVQATLLEQPQDPRNRRVGMIGVNLKEQEISLAALRPCPRLRRVESLGRGLRRRRIDGDRERVVLVEGQHVSAAGSRLPIERCRHGHRRRLHEEGESLRKPRVAAQQFRRDGATRAETAIAEQLRQRTCLCFKLIAGIVPDAVLERQLT